MIEVITPVKGENASKPGSDKMEVDNESDLEEMDWPKQQE